jgi:hypothetical protein
MEQTSVGTERVTLRGSVVPGEYEVTKPTNRTAQSIFLWGEGDDTLRLPEGVAAAERLSQNTESSRKNSIVIMRETIAARRVWLQQYTPQELSLAWTVAWAFGTVAVLAVVAVFMASTSTEALLADMGDVKSTAPIDRREALRESQEAFFREQKKLEAWKAFEAVEAQNSDAP